jgi:50S ribosomal protein L16 3-hydroxylase
LFFLFFSLSFLLLTLLVIQTNGTKEWRIGKTFVSHKEEIERLIPNMDVRILRPPEKKEEEIVLIVHPGDVLYLPPRISHEGTALTDDCCTLSVGCRAPSAVEFITHLLADETLISSSSKMMKRYQDPSAIQDLIQSATKPTPIGRGQITREAKQTSKQLILDAIHDILENDDNMWDLWFGKYVTQPKRLRNSYPSPLVGTNEVEEDEWISNLGVWGNPKLTVQAIMNGRGCLYQAEGIVFAYSREKNKFNRLFVHGQVWETSDPNIPMDIIANERRITIDSFPNGTICSNTKEILEDLVGKGFLYGSEE